MPSSTDSALYVVRLCSDELHAVLVAVQHSRCGMMLQIFTYHFFYHCTCSEHVLLPLSNFEVIGMRRDERHPCLNVLEISLNINMNAQKLEDMEESRKHTCVEFGEEVEIIKRLLIVQL